MRRLVGTVILVAMGLSAAYSANTWDLRDRFRPPVTRLGDRTPLPAVAVPDARIDTPLHDIRSQPWWQPITTLRGEGDVTTEEFIIDRHALQWRVTWRCAQGSFRVVPTEPSDRSHHRGLVDAACPGEGTGFSVKTGRFALKISATAPWQATVEQQVDSPLVEPPPPEIDSSSARVLASATVYGVDRVGRGMLRIVAFPDGRRMLRLDDFFVSINSDLELWLSEHPHPKSTPEARSAGHRRVSFLKATAGAMNYELPGDVDLGRYRSIVIWCELTSNAYAAASLQH